MYDEQYEREFKETWNETIARLETKSKDLNLGIEWLE